MSVAYFQQRLSGSYANVEVAFFRCPDNRKPHEEYGLSPKPYWGYVNWLEYEEHLNGKAMSSNGAAEEEYKKKLLLYRDCFKWYVVLFACHAKLRDA